jgi:tRNA-dihydrouridine synthase
MRASHETSEGEELASQREAVRGVLGHTNLAMQPKEDPWSFWKRIGSPTRVLAPLVAQSELAFRMLARRHGAQMCWTPMLHADQLTLADGVYMASNFDPHPQDRPLVVQLCGNDASTLLAAAKLLQPRCDAVEINCGCPQGCARRGGYGAFLLEDPTALIALVQELSAQLTVPVLVKMRLVEAAVGGGRRGARGRGARDQAGEALQAGESRERCGEAERSSTLTLPAEPAAPGVLPANGEQSRVLDPVGWAAVESAPSTAHSATVALAMRLEAAGCSVLTLHGRTASQKGSCEADWSAVAAVKAAISIPVIANGGVETAEQLEACRQATGADAIMCGEAALENVRLFCGHPTRRESQCALALEYLALAKQHSAPVEFVRAAS